MQTESAGYLIVDIGSTTTKALLIEQDGGQWRLTHRAEAGTTVEAPYEDVMIGVRRAIGDIEQFSGRRLLDDGELVAGAESCCQFLATSSAGGGLQVLVCGLSKAVTVESAERAALGAGAIIMDVFSPDDGRGLLAHLEALRRARPDMVLLAGGIESALNVNFVIEFCDLLNSAKPQPRFGQSYAVPVIYAGCVNGAPLAADTLNSGFELHVVPNIRPSFDTEQLGPARDAMHELFLSHVMAQAPGYTGVTRQTAADVLPTPVAVGKIMSRLAERDGIDILGADIGGATTDVFSVIDGRFSRSVSANLGMSYSAGNVVASGGIASVVGWLPFGADPLAIQNEIMDKLLNPTSVPATWRDLIVEQALARVALGLSLGQHVALTRELPRETNPMLRALQSQNRNFSVGVSRKATLDRQAIDLIVGSGGVLSHAPRRQQAALMLLDAFCPQGETFLAVDSVFMMPHLGVLSEIAPSVALEVLERDCFVPLGTSFCLYSTSGKSQAAMAAEFEVALDGSSSVRGSVAIGELRVVPLPAGQLAQVSIRPVAGVNAGAGEGRPISRQAKGGQVGVIIDARVNFLADQPLERRVALNRRAAIAIGAFTVEELEVAVDAG